MNGWQTKQILRAQDQDYNLNEWEHGFIDSLADKEADYELSETQNTILNRISEKLD